MAVPPSGNFCQLKNVSLDKDNGTFTRSNTDVVEKVSLLVAASRDRGTSVADRNARGQKCTWTEMHVDRNGFVLVTFDSSSGIFSKTKW